MSDPENMTPQSLAEACAAAMWANDQASQELGMKIELVAPGRSVLTMSILPRMLNGHGICHGGFIYCLADSAFAFACNAYNQRTVAQHCSITYISPVREGDSLCAEAVETSRSGRSGIYDVKVTNQKDETVAQFRGHSRTIKGTHLQESNE